MLSRMYEMMRMNGLAKVLAVGAAMVLSAAVASAGAFSRVVIDAGHGDQDVGGHHNRVYEKHLALDTALGMVAGAYYCLQ